MKSREFLRAALALGCACLACTSGCNEPLTTQDAGGSIERPDTALGAGTDAAALDAARPDSSVPADAGAPDAGSPDSGGHFPGTDAALAGDSGTEQADAGPTCLPPDAGSCGASGQPCCASGGCEWTSCCVGGTCVGTGAPCGTGFGACQLDPVTGRAQCATCGGSGQPCCGGTCPAATSLACGPDGMCGPCGDLGEPCCAAGSPAGRCSSAMSLLACGLDGLCGACGSPGQLCCGGGHDCYGGGCCVGSFCVAAGGSCGEGLGVCSGATCDGCGQEGQPCCPYQGSLQCKAAQRCVCGSCQPCGGQGQPCCDGSCDTGLACTGGLSGTCEPCGAAGQPCCALSTCTSPLVCGTHGCGACGQTGDVPCADNTCENGGCYDLMTHKCLGPGDACYFYTGGVCSDGSCTDGVKSCGALGQPCCTVQGWPGTPPTWCGAASATCGGSGTCVHCGAPGEPCCGDYRGCAAPSVCSLADGGSVCRE